MMKNNEEPIPTVSESVSVEAEKLQRFAGSTEKLRRFAGSTEKLQRFACSDAMPDEGTPAGLICRADGCEEDSTRPVSSCLSDQPRPGTNNAAYLPSSRCSSCRSEAYGSHRLKKNRTVHLHCTACVLLDYKGMYCSQCFQVYAALDLLGDPALWLTCSKCHRLCHMECAQRPELSTDASCFACQYCQRECSAKDQQGSASLKRPRIDDCTTLSDQETLAAAQIVAIFASKEATRAKDQAKICAAVAAKAAKLAKSALDVAHRAGLDEARWRFEAQRQATISTPLHLTARKFPNTYIGGQLGIDGGLHKKMLMPPHQRDVGKTFGNDTDSSKAGPTTNLSHHQRRVLPPVASTSVSGPPFMPSRSAQMPTQQQSSTTGLFANGHHMSLSSLADDLRFARVSSAAEGVSSSEGVLESSLFGKTPKSSSVAPYKALGRDAVHTVNTMEIVSDEEAVDDLIDVGDLLAEGFEKEQRVPDGVIDKNVAHTEEETSCVDKNVDELVTGAHAGLPPGATLTASSQGGEILETKVPGYAADIT